MESFINALNTLIPFIVGYMVFFSIILISVISLIIYIFVQIIKGNKEFKQMRNERLNRKRH